MLKVIAGELYVLIVNARSNHSNDLTLQYL
jgi:hypothetical protein